MQKEMQRYAEMFGVEQSIGAGLINFKTLAFVVRESLVLPVDQFHRDVLDKLYPVVSRDEYSFIQSLFKINRFINSESNPEQIASAKKGLMISVERIERMIESESLDDFVSLSHTSDERWKDILNKKPVADNLEPDPDEQPSFGVSMSSVGFFVVPCRDPNCTHCGGAHRNSANDNNEPECTIM